VRRLRACWKAIFNLSDQSPLQIHEQIFTAMSMETHVFFRGKLPSKAALSRAMKELGFPFAVKPATGSLEQQSGFMPMLLRREETGVEFDVYRDHFAVEEFADEGVDQGFEQRASFRWGGDFQEAVAGMCAAAALAKLTNGVVFDEAENKLLSVDGAIEVARRSLQSLWSKPKARFGTGPADIKRYLNPLLEQRSDLVLLGRRLIVRPVRHLLRGVFFDRTSDKYQFRLWRYICPLFAGAEGAGYGDYIYSPISRVWEPDFEPLLFDSLAEDLFDYVGKITTLEGFASVVEAANKYHSIAVTAFVLSGQLERAAQLVNAMERADEGRWRSWIGEQRSFLARDIKSTCAEFRAEEAQTAEKLKLGDAWEPAPFAAEIPEANRTTRCAELLFTTAPWIGRPPGLVEEVPERPGEVRFAKAQMWRNDRVIMLVPLSREVAEEMHRTYQDYVLATRLPEGNPLVLRHHTGLSPHDPEQPRNPDYVPRRDFCLEMYGSLGRLQATFDEPIEHPGIVQMRSLSVFDRATGDEIWYAYNSFNKREKSISDDRDADKGNVCRALSDSDVALCEFEAPPFGEFTDMWRRIEQYLKNEGFGEFT
jgi:hypothetical protein